MNSVCKNCPDRRIGCHGSCTAYRIEAARNEADRRDRIMAYAGEYKNGLDKIAYRRIMAARTAGRMA
jgi:hypothetical protein